MAEKSKFIEELNSRYQPKGEYIVLGKGMLDGEVITDGIVTGKQIGRASCRERVSSPV